MKQRWHHKIQERERCSDPNILLGVSSLVTRVNLDFGSQGSTRMAFWGFGLLDKTYARVGGHMLLSFSTNVR